MTASTAGIQLRGRSRRLRVIVELLSSMRFAISLLTLICIAAVIGTVVQQSQPATNYINQFGPFWADVFGAVNLYTVYSAPWFLVILGFLVLSTSLCIARNAPKIVADLGNFRENLRAQSLQAFRHRGEGTTDEPRDAALARIAAVLAAHGWAAKAQVRDDGVMIAARKGRANKLGYIAAHAAIVLICIGGLLDGDLIVRAQMALQGKETYAGGGLVADVPDKHRLSPNNPAYRGNLFVPEGARAGIAVLTMPSGIVLQPLPFDVELERFVVEYYDTGMPRLFASEVVIHDREIGTREAHKIEVNKPAIHRGIAIYQSSFDDGGSRVVLRALPLHGADSDAPDVEGRIGKHADIVGPGGERATLEFAALRVVNVENLGDVESRGAGDDGADERKVDLGDALEARLGSGTKVRTKRELRNVGPSITYRIRDAAGQAREYHNYMLPMTIDGAPMFLAGVREQSSDEFRYLRIPADGDNALDGWLRIKRALGDAALREQAARRYARIAAPADRPDVAAQLVATTRRTLDLFAGAETGTPAAPSGAPLGGLSALSDFIERTVPEADRERIGQVLIRILGGALFELQNAAREQVRLPPVKADAEGERFIALALTSLSDSFFYPAPQLFQLREFTQVQASVFQVARAPGKTLVYLGAVCLIVGVFMMLYVRDRRLWVWLRDAPDAAPGDRARTRIATALSSTRRTLDGDAEFERLRDAFLARNEGPKR